VAKVLKLIFVKKSGIGLLLEGGDLLTYAQIHQKAVEAYKRENTESGKISGKVVRCQITQVSKEEFEQMNMFDRSAETDQIIMLQDNGLYLQLKGDSFTNYQTQHFEGLKLLGIKSELKGKVVQITF
jgi:hypothetical protein